MIDDRRIDNRRIDEGTFVVLGTTPAFSHPPSEAGTGSPKEGKVLTLFYVKKRVYSPPLEGCCLIFGGFSIQFGFAKSLELTHLLKVLFFK